MKFAIYIFILLILINSCGEKCPCPNESIIPIFVSYSNNETDTIIIRRYQKGTNFSQLVDSFSWTYDNTSRVNKGDSIWIFAVKLEQRINDKYDWQVINPFDNKNFSISDIIVKPKEIHCGGIFGLDKGPCVSPIVSYKRDNIPVVANDNDPSTWFIIKK